MRGATEVTLALCLTLVVRAVCADVFAGAGGGIKHTSGPGVHVNVSIYDDVELHYSNWNDGEHDHAVGVGYRFENGNPISVVLGMAYVNSATENLLHRADAYIELRWRFTRQIACQISHYSTIGDDVGDNLGFCGVLFTYDRRPVTPLPFAGPSADSSVAVRCAKRKEPTVRPRFVHRARERRPREQPLPIGADVREPGADRMRPIGIEQ